MMGTCGGWLLLKPPVTPVESAGTGPCIHSPQIQEPQMRSRFVGRSMAEATLRQGLLQYLPNSCSLAAYSLQRTSSPNHCACHGHIMSCPAPLCSVRSPHVLSHPVSSRATLSCPIVFHPVPSHHVPFCPTVSCLVPSCLIMSHSVPPHHFPSCPVPSVPVLSHVTLSSCL